jgi:hypothetical protein
MEALSVVKYRQTHRLDKINDMAKTLLCLLILASIACGGEGENGGDVPPPFSTPDKFGCSTLLESPPRGLSTMYCNLDVARGQCEKLMNVVGRSCLKRPAISYLVDGTFGFNHGHINHDIHTLATSGRELNVLFYLTSGPTQRRYKTQTYGELKYRQKSSDVRFNTMQHSKMGMSI